MDRQRCQYITNAIAVNIWWHKRQKWAVCRLGIYFSTYNEEHALFIVKMLYILYFSRMIVDILEI